MNLAFAGTPDIAAVILTALLESSQHNISHVYTQPDRRSGRGRKTVQGPVKLVAQQYGIPVKQPATPHELGRDDDLNNIDALIVVAYGLILPDIVLSRPRCGCINVHASLLPRWRGAAPIQRAIQAGDKQTGISIMLMDSGIDTGQVMLQKPCVISGDDTAASLSGRLASLGGECLLEALADVATGSVSLVDQDDEFATYAAKVSKQEAEIDWNATAEQVERNVRAFNPAPVAFTVLNNVKIRVWETRTMKTGDVNVGDVNTGSGEIISYAPEGLDVSVGPGTDLSPSPEHQALRILSLQLEGKKKQSVREFYNGYPDLFVR